MRLTEYTIRRSEDRLVLQKRGAWFLWGLVGASFPLAGLTFVGQGIFRQPPRDLLSALLFLVMCAFMAFILYRVLIWGRCLVFDRRRDRLLIDGRRVCALSDLSWVGIEGSPRSPLAPGLGRFCSLRLRTVRGRDIVLKSAWESHQGYSDLTGLGGVIADFVGASSNITRSVVQEAGKPAA